MTINVYLTNLGKYNEGDLVGQWIKLDGALEYSELKEGGKYDIGLNDSYEEYFITDWESPTEIHEYTSIDRLNEIYEILAEIKEETGLEDDDIKAILKVIDLEELHENMYDLVMYQDCNDMEDVAYQYIQETGLLDDIMPEGLQSYFDYKKFGRDMEMERTFIFTRGNCIELAY